MDARRIQPEVLQLPQDLAERWVRDSHVKHGRNLDHLRSLDFHDRHLQLEVGWSLSLYELLGLAAFPGDHGGKSVVMEYFRFLWDDWIQVFVGDRDGAEFSAAMRASRTVLGGDAALSLLSYHCKNPVDYDTLDFYCPRDKFDQFSTFVVNTFCGTVIRELDRHDLQDPHSGCDCQEFLHGCTHIRLDTGIIFHVYCSTTLSPLAPIASSYSTHLFNFVTPDSFCVAYPELHEDSLALCSPMATEDAVRHAREHYGSLGWRFGDTISDLYDNVHGHTPGCVPLPYCPSRRRFFGDSLCVSVVFRERYVSEVFTGCPSNLNVHAADAQTLSWTTGWVYGGKGCGEIGDNVLIARSINAVVVPGLPVLY